MNKGLLQILVCPRCKGPLEYRRRQAELVCHQDKLAYPVRKGIPVLLEMDARELSVQK